MTNSVYFYSGENDPTVGLQTEGRIFEGYSGLMGLLGNKFTKGP